MKKIMILSLFFMTLLSMNGQQLSWTADNGNGTYTNPLFYDEFSDPDIIRVGDSFYLVGTTMHCIRALWCWSLKTLSTGTSAVTRLTVLTLMMTDSGLKTGKKPMARVYGLLAYAIMTANSTYFQTSTE